MAPGDRLVPSALVFEPCADMVPYHHGDAARSAAARRTSSYAARYADATGDERFDPREMYECDGWMCRLCGGEVDRTRPSADPMAPTLDHVIPRAQGGPHTRANTQLAHRVCNQRKGARAREAHVPTSTDRTTGRSRDGNRTATTD
jgi:5-methylcytosine-specific restriction endonuclease McrA